MKRTRAPSTYRKKALDNDVVHFVLRQASQISYCSFSAYVCQEEFIPVERHPRHPGTPVTCFACLMEAEEIA